MGAQETMRLYPAGGVASSRLPTGRKAVVLNGGKLVVPPGVILHTPITAIQNSEANWERACEFLPSRWEHVRGQGQPARPCSVSVLQHGAPIDLQQGPRASAEIYNLPPVSALLLGRLPPRRLPRLCPTRRGSMHCGRTAMRLCYAAKSPAT